MRPSQAALAPAQPAGRGAAVLRGHRERGVFAALAVLALAALFLNRWGWVTPDTDPQLYYAPGRTLIRALFAWRSDPFLGHRNFNAGLAPTAAVVLLIRALGASVWVTIRILRAGLLVLAGWGAVRLFDHVSRQPDRSAGRLAACVLYVANPYVVLSGASLPVLLPYAIFPWMLLAFARSIERPRSWRWPAAFALTFFSMGGMNAGVVPLYLLLGIPSYLLYSRVGSGGSSGRWPPPPRSASSS